MKIKFNKVISFLLDPKIFFLIAAFSLVSFWFSKNLLFGGTEAGIPTYTPEKTLKQIVWLWWEALGPGSSFPTAVASIPLYFFMTIFERIGLDAIAIQKILFFIIIYLQGFGASLVFKTVVDKDSRLQTLAGLFYIFNPFMMIFVWHRFIYANFILSATLPFFIYFYLQLLENGKFKSIVFFLITSFFASYMFSSIAPVIVIWFAILMCFLTAIILNRKNFKKITRLTFLTLILFIFWILTNVWWIYPLISTRSVLNIFSNRGNVDTLVAISQQSTINYVIRGVNPYILFFQKDWGSIYENFLFQLLSWIPVLFIFSSLLKRDNKGKMWYMIILFLFGIFAAKGAADPLGRVVAWIYANVFILGVIRNTFEKLGLLVILPASILASVGVKNIWSLYIGIYPKFGKFFIKTSVIVLLIGCGIYVWPMFTDKLFGSEKYPPFFTLPEDYPQVISSLEKELELDGGKVLHLPISEGDSATYNWKYTYNGVELAYHLFPGASISRQLYIPFIDQQLQEVARIFHTTDYNLQKNILSSLGVKYIVLNKNLNWYSRNIDKPGFVLDILNGSPDLKVINETENLKVYKFVPNSNPTIFQGREITLISGNMSGGSSLDYILDNLNKEGGVYLQKRKDQQIPKDLLKREITFPTRIIDTALQSDKHSDVIILRPFVKHLPDMFYYPLITLREKIEFFLTPPYQKPLKRVFFTQKRLLEAKALKEQNKDVEFNKSIRKYVEYLDFVISEINKIPDGQLDTIENIILKMVFSEEKETLENMLGQTSDEETKNLIKTNIEKIIEFRKEQGFESYYVYTDQQQKTVSLTNTYIYQFLISHETNPEVIMNVPNSQLFNLGVGSRIKIFLDGQLRDLVAKEESRNIFSLGEINLKQGIHEIAISVPVKSEIVQTANFIKSNGIIEVEKSSNNLIKMTTVEQNSWVEYSLKDYNPDKTYILGFFYHVIRGAYPQIQFWQDSDELRKGKDPKIVRGLEGDPYDFDWKYIELSISSNNNASIRLDRTATRPIIRIFIPFWNNCEGRNSQNVKLCKNLEFKKAYNKSSVVEIRDFKIKESFTGTVFLNSILNNEFIPKDLNFKKISPVEYLVATDNNTQPLFITLNEGFHTGWKVIPDSNKQIPEENHFLTNGYGNGWLIEEPGKQSFKIKFIPQDFLFKGMAISIGSFILAIILMLIPLMNKRKNG